MSRTELHSHSQLSNLRLRDALPTPEALIDRAIEIGLSGIAITDHESLSAHPRANKYAQTIKKDNPNFKVILGNEIYLVDKRPADNGKHYHFILLAKDKIGHRQLRMLSTIAWLNDYSSSGMTRVDTLKSDLKRIVKKDPGHLIASTACIGGELGQEILRLTKAEKLKDTQGAQEAHNKIVEFILWCKEVFGADFYLEVQPGVSEEQITVNKRIVPIAKAFGLKIIPASDTHYLKREDRYAHKSFLSSENKEREVDAFYQDTYLHTDEEMIEKFKSSGYDEAFTASIIDNTKEIYDKIEEYSLLHTQQVPEVPVPFIEKKEPRKELEKYETLASMYKSDDIIDRYWVNTCIDKLIELGKYNEDYLEELEEEAQVKTVVGNKLNTNMFAYPVTLAHYIQLIWDCGSTVGAGRGSACSALNHYLLNITQLDPIEQDFPFFRYMNRDTDGLGDIDIDVAPSKVQTIISKIREERGKLFNEDIDDKLVRESLGAVYVCTFGKETTKSAILTSCRGYRSEQFPDGIDNDTAQYLSSLIPQERGFIWSISDVVNGNPEKGRKPVKTFLKELKNYPGLLSIIQSIEGCISRRSRHASGVLFMGKDPFEFNAFMKTPSGEIVTQYDLHDAEACGSVKMDILVTSVQDKIVRAIEFLKEDNVIDKNLSIKEAYDKYLHPDVLPLQNKTTWKTIQEASSLDLFQLDSPIGRQGAKKVKPKNMSELSATNGLIRLMTAEKGEETYLDKYVRFKNDPSQLRQEMLKYNLSKEEIQLLLNYVGSTYGIGISQEQLMRALMDKDICGFTLKEANSARKIVSKKKMNEIPNFKKKVIESAKSSSLARYVWDYIVAPGLGYSFSDIHSVSYSYIGFQTAYLATNWNPIYWNTACLVVNSGSLQDGSDSNKTTDYGTMAKAIGDTISNNINVSLVNINSSSFGFKPDVENNRILFGMKGMNKMGTDVVKQIIQNRPYKSVKDFMARCPLNKAVMISLIKGGAFDELDNEWASKICPENPRKAIMIYYIDSICGKKQKITLQNIPTLISQDLIPQELSRQKAIFNFNKSLKAYCKNGTEYVLDDAHLSFLNKTFPDYEGIEYYNSFARINEKSWNKVYQKEMDILRQWIKENQNRILDLLNEQLFKETWEKYAKGNISSWEMDSLCFYYHDHELKNLNVKKYGISNFNDLPEQPEVEEFFKRGGRYIPIYKTTSIAGTVIDKDNTRSSISLLTTTGVVTVKFSKEYYAMYNRQLSEIQDDGTKKVVEKGWMTRGQMLLLTGFRREDTFVPKTYTRTQLHQIYKITSIDQEGNITIEHERANTIGGI